MHINSTEQWKLSKYLIDEIYNRASGKKYVVCERNYPRDVYFIGNLRPVPRKQEEENELINKLAPVAFGTEFKFIKKSEKITVYIKLNWNCYYRVIPTYQEQVNFQASDTYETGNSQLKERVDINEDPDEENVEIMRDSKHPPQKDTFYIKFRKIECHANGIIEIQGGKIDKSDLEKSILHEIKRAQQIVINDPERMRTNTIPEHNVKVSQEILASEITYKAFTDSLTTDVIPQWSWEVRAEVRSEQDSNGTVPLLHLEFVNTSPMVDSPNTEPYFFDVYAEITFDGCEIIPFEIELFPSGFRYNREMWARGLNCAVEKLHNSAFKTTNLPTYTQMRYSTRDFPVAKFEELAKDPVPVLENILRNMKDYYAIDWLKFRNKYESENKEWNQRFGDEFDKDREKFLEEIQLFERGIEILKSNPDALYAFKLTNETFRRGDPRKNAWRLFQVVFLVSQIPSITSIDNFDSPDYEQRKYVDIIYFPTGGGKTEAYLSVLVFHCFFDRLRGKTAGVTAWTRFPLRLLTLQQTQRIADAILLAELVRLEQHDPRLISEEVDGFGVGYFVGSEATPNEITSPIPGKSPDPNWSKANDELARQDWKRIYRCPSCRTNNVIVEFDKEKVRVLHRCQEKNCAFPNGILPVYVIDNEIYRYLPSVIVGTIDKLAGLGNQRKFALLFGQVDGKCKIHGYYKASCCQKECRDKTKLVRKIPKGISGPTLFVQDELHLLKEGLGTFDAHYETFTQNLLLEFGQKSTLKIIASSATIEAFERQVEHLYGRERKYARVFPGLGPTLGESFYANTLEYPQRIFIGIIPHNKTIFNAVLELIQYYHEIIYDLEILKVGTPNPYGGTIVPGTTEWFKLLDLYTTSLTYFLSNRELDSIRTDIEGDVIPNLENKGYKPLHVIELTGNTSTDKVTAALDILQKVKKQNEPSHAVLATSMISHGVDVDRLNAMFFYGMPRQNAEYIQASSRVGRTHVGLVFVCLHPARERDQSHYSYFVKFHEFLGQLVEPVAINRWSTFSINRTLPGLFMATLLQLIAHKSNTNNPNQYYLTSFVKKLIVNREITADDFIPILEKAYQVNGHHSVNTNTFRNEISELVNFYLDYILQSGAQDVLVSDTLIPKPLLSLRDVDEPIEIELDNEGTLWAIRSGRV